MAGDVPVWIKLATLEKAEEILTQGLDLGATGLWLGESVFVQSDPSRFLAILGETLHQNKQAERT
jgi:DhnA family fructose-bisphosphate aldolase class Ia